jgi:predicted small lipoprotein YifL
MKWLLAAALAMTGCGNYGNIYMPEGQRKPMLGPEPGDFKSMATIGKEVSHVKVRLTPSADRSLKLRVDCTGAASARTWVNARALPGGACPYEAAVPDGTMVPGTAAMVELEFGTATLVKQIRLEP